RGGGGDAGRTGAHDQDEEIRDFAPGEPRRGRVAVHRSGCGAGSGQGGACRAGGGELSAAILLLREWRQLTLAASKRVSHSLSARSMAGAAAARRKMWHK